MSVYWIIGTRTGQIASKLASLSMTCNHQELCLISISCCSVWRKVGSNTFEANSLFGNFLFLSFFSPKIEKSGERASECSSQKVMRRMSNRISGLLWCNVDQALDVRRWSFRCFRDGCNKHTHAPIHPPTRNQHTPAHMNTHTRTHTILASDKKQEMPWANQKNYDLKFNLLVRMKNEQAIKAQMMWSRCAGN